MAINYPSWVQLKTNILNILSTIATEEALEDPARIFKVEKDRWRPWIESQQNIPLVNIMVSDVAPASNGSAARTHTQDEVTIDVDMYVLGESTDLLPADQICADRLDLLVAQVRAGLTRLDLIDFGFDVGTIDRSQALNLTYYSQEGETSLGQYAPARWSFSVILPFEPSDKKEYPNLEEINVSVSDETLEQYALKFIYP